MPWLQEPDGGDVWSRWGVAYRDVVVVDHEGKVASVTNLTDNDLGDATNLAEFKQSLLDAASK